MTENRSFKKCRNFIMLKNLYSTRYAPSKIPCAITDKGLPQ